MAFQGAKLSFRGQGILSMIHGMGSLLAGAGGVSGAGKGACSLLGLTNSPNKKLGPRDGREKTKLLEHTDALCLLARWENPGWMGTPLVIACLMVGLTCLLAGLAEINNIALCGLLVMLLLAISSTG